MLMLALAIAVLCIAVAVLSAPLVLQRLEPYAPQPASRAQPPQGDARPGREREAEQVLEALSELEHSRLSGKLSDADYAAQRERLEAEYLRIASPPEGDPG
jgi:hypothetical protein